MRGCFLGVTFTDPIAPPTSKFCSLQFAETFCRETADLYRKLQGGLSSKEKRRILLLGFALVNIHVQLHIVMHACITLPWFESTVSYLAKSGRVSYNSWSASILFSLDSIHCSTDDIRGAVYFHSCFSSKHAQTVKSVQFGNSNIAGQSFSHWRSLTFDAIFQ